MSAFFINPLHSECQPLWHLTPLLPSVFHRTHRRFDWPHQEGGQASPPKHLPTAPNLLIASNPCPTLISRFPRSSASKSKMTFINSKVLGFSTCSWLGNLNPKTFCLVYKGVKDVKSSYCSSKGWESHGKPREISTKTMSLRNFQPNSEANGRHDFSKGKEVTLTCLLKTSKNRSDEGKSGPAMSSVQPSFSSFFSRHFQDFDLLHPPCRDAQVKQTASKSLKRLLSLMAHLLLGQ